MDNPIEPIRNLANKVKTATADMGLELVGYSVVPSMDGVGPDMLQLVFGLRPESLLTPEQRKAKAAKDDLDAQFNALMSGVEQSIESDKVTEQIDKARADTEAMLKDFLSDD